ncbi:ricin-type beta-trefoil lectin domain protein [Streptomyces sp. NPDC054765]
MGRRLSDALTGHMKDREPAEEGRFSVGGRVMAATAGVVVLAGAALGVGALVHSLHGPSPKSMSAAGASTGTGAPSASPRHGRDPGNPSTPRRDARPPGSPDATSLMPGTPMKPVPGTPMTAVPGTPMTADSPTTRRPVPSGKNPASPQTYTVVGYASQRCISVVGNAERAGASIDIWDCGNRPGQRWSANSDGTWSTLNMCMTAAGTGKGSAITLEPCNGGANQKFQLNAAHDIVNPAANSCVDAKDKKTNNGTHLQLWPCAGTSNQKWHI